MPFSDCARESDDDVNSNNFSIKTDIFVGN